MLDRPSDCNGCPLNSIATGYMRPTLAGRDRYGVTLVGEALDETEAELGSPFVGKAGFRLTRLIEWAGFDRSRFDIINTAWCRPPDNKLEGTWYETQSISHCRTAHWGHLLDRSSVIVPMGNVPTGHFLGRKGILSLRGYVHGDPSGGRHILPTVHPSFIARGQSKYSAAFINDLQKAVELARRGLVIEPTDYLLDPSPRAAYEWALGVVANGRGVGENHPHTLFPQQDHAGHVRIAFDIETPGKGEDEGEMGDDDDPSCHIQRIGFSAGPLSGMSVPWGGEYIPAIRTLLDNPLPKVVWNAGFDVPRVRSKGISIGGVIHDGMVAWHILHSDLPKGLGFVATFTCPWQHEWKSMSGRAPALYNVIDADVEWRSMEWIERELRSTGLWDVYERDVLRLDPILVFMSSQGMPVDNDVRIDRAVRLALAQDEVMAQVQAAVPLEAKRLYPPDGFVREPDDKTDCITIERETEVKVCSMCGVRWKAGHNRTYKRPTEKRPQNPCAGGSAIPRIVPVTRYARVEPFKPSKEQMIRYHQVMNRPIPMKWDKKAKMKRPAFDKEAMRKLMIKYPTDPLYQLLLTYRDADKIAGTYIGRPIT